MPCTGCYDVLLLFGGLGKEWLSDFGKRYFFSLLKRKYRVNTKVLEAIIQGKELNKKSEPEKRRFKDQFDFWRAVSALATSRKNENLVTQELLGAIIQMEEVFASFDIIKTLRDKEISVENRVLFYIICDDYTFGIDKMTDLSELLKDVFDSPGDRLTYRSSIIGLENPLIKEEWIEGVGENSVKLTNQGIKLFLRDKAKAFIKPIEGLDCYGFASAVKKIYREADSDRPGFSDEIKKKLFRLEFSNQHLDFVNKLEMDYDALDRFLFYNHVDISSTKSCWFGESEKLIKEVFKRYEDICEHSEKRPILLFNEADGIFSKRKDTDSSNVAQTENTIQNIILEEMERLDGILIATTNMAENLDGAFERRFLFKIKFDKPTLEARKNIWLSKMPSLSYDNAGILATSFPFSGGEIDNIVRKATIMEVLGGKKPEIQDLKRLCREEKLHDGSSRIGFNT